jgi:hypothetical protein
MCAWCGPVFLVLFVVGLWFIAGLVPPVSGHDSAAHVAAFYAGHYKRLRIGMTVCLLGLPLLGPFIVLISRQIREHSPQLSLLADIQLIMGIVGLVVFLIFECVMATIAFRPDMAPDTIRTLNDLAWTSLLWPFTPFSLEYFVIGLAVMRDKGERPLHPRWVGYVSLLTAALFALGGPTLWATQGAFSWRGILTLWAVLGAFGIWVLVTSWSMLRAIASEPEPAPAA